MTEKRTQELPHDPRSCGCNTCKARPHVAIVGSRDFHDLDAVRRYVDTLPADAVVISGGARGVDRTAENAAAARGLCVWSIPAEWAKYDKAAGYIRNREIVAVADRIVAFWDGKSRGTEHTINLAREDGKPVEIVR